MYVRTGHATEAFGFVKSEALRVPRHVETAARAGAVGTEVGAPRAPASPG